MPRHISARIKRLRPSATFKLDTAAKELQRQGADVISFALGEPDFPTPKHICEAAAQAIAAGKTKYTPAAGIPELREAIAAKISRELGKDYKPSQVVVSNGGKHALMNVWQCILEPGDEVIIISPYWVSYADQVELCDAVPKVIPTTADTNFQPDLDDVRAALSPRTAAILINSPSNPTGAVLERAIIEGLAGMALEVDAWIVSDEIYRHILFDGRTHFSAAMVSEEVRERTIICDGVSKTYSMTGWRIGWLVAPEEVAKAAGNLQGQETSNPNSIAQWAALAALQGAQDCVEEMRAEFERRRDYIIGALTEIEGVKISKPGGAFYAFPDVSSFLQGQLVYEGQPIRDDLTLCEYLLREAHISVVPGSAFGADGYVRFSFATSLERIQEGIRRFREALGR